MRWEDLGCLDVGVESLFEGIFEILYLSLQRP